MNHIITILLFAVVYFLFIMHNNNHKTENFSGVGDQNAYTNLTCLQDDNGDKHVFKVLPNITGTHVTYHKLHHPDRLSKTDGTQYIGYDDLVESGKNVPCADGEFSTSLKSIRDPESKASKLFLKINSATTKTNKSTWQQHECTITDINNGKTNNGKIDPKAHWCYKVHNTIINNLDTLCSDKPGKVPANYCKDLKDKDAGTDAYVKSTKPEHISLKNKMNYLVQNGASSLTKFTRNVSAIPQEDTLDNGEYYCFKDNYGNKIDPSGAMCYNTDSSKNIKPYPAIVDKEKIMCNPGDTLQSTICKNASGVSYAPELSDPTNPKCSNASDALDSSGNPWSICTGTGIFDQVDFKPSSKTFGQILYKNTGNHKKCTDDLIKKGSRPPAPAKGFCVRAATSDEYNVLKKTKWANNYTDQLNALMYPDPAASS
jgi:hypothetical protein